MTSKKCLFFFDNYIKNFSPDLEQTKMLLLNYFSSQPCYSQFSDEYIELLVKLEINKYIGIEQEFLVEKDKFITDAIKAEEMELFKKNDPEAVFTVDNSFEKEFVKS